jgi:hemerythrin-like metal-binding protein
VTPQEHVDHIVRDHADINDLVAQLRAATERGDHATMKSLLIGLEMLEAKHYAREDALMRAVGYTNADAHRAEHAKMLDTLRSINETLVWENMGAISPQVVAHIEAAVAHMTDADQALNRAVSSNAAPARG